jgi:cell division protein FtsA
VRNMANCISRCHLDISAAVVSSYASALSCLVEDEMDLGVAVIDMGGGTTKLSVFNEGVLVHTDIIPVGGMHVTSDIARGLGTPILQAERLKTLHGHALLMSMDDNEIIDVPQIGEDQYSQSGPISKSILVSIIQPRLEETFELIKSRLAASGFDKIVGRHIVLTGGASLLPGMRELASLVFNKQVRVGRPVKLNGLSAQDASASCATLIGLLVYAQQNKTLWGRAAPSLENSGKAISRFRAFFKRSA